MSYAVRAWRDAKGVSGITIGMLTASGYDSVVAETDLTEAECGAFISECQQAMKRAAAATGPLRENLPGAYESWDQHPQEEERT